jgi:hypothetical protein
MPKTSDLEATFDRLWEMLAGDQPAPVAEYAFAKPRRWRFDRAWPAYRLAVELEGGVFAVPVRCNHCRQTVTWPVKNRSGVPTGKRVQVMGAVGGHTRGEQYAQDCDKYNAAASLGWRVLRYTTLHLRQSPAQTIDQIKALLAQGPVVAMDQQETFPVFRTDKGQPKPF